MNVSRWPIAKLMMLVVVVGLNIAAGRARNVCTSRHQPAARVGSGFRFHTGLLVRASSGPAGTNHTSTDQSRC